MRPSVAHQVRERVQASPPRSLLRAGDFHGPTPAVESALSRLASKPQDGLLRVRKGLYWKPVETRFGPIPPAPMDVALVVAGPGAGPAGLAAASVLGLTTQVPSILEVAVPGRVPRPVEGVRFRQRGYHRRALKLRPLEVAILEVLREEPVVTEVSSSELAARVRRLIEDGTVRLPKLREAVALERDTRVRSRFAPLEKALVSAPAR